MKKLIILLLLIFTTKLSFCQNSDTYFAEEIESRVEDILMKFGTEIVDSINCDCNCSVDIQTELTYFVNKDDYYSPNIDQKILIDMMDNETLDVVADDLDSFITDIYYKKRNLDGTWLNKTAVSVNVIGKKGSLSILRPYFYKGIRFMRKMTYIVTVNIQTEDKK